MVTQALHAPTFLNLKQCSVDSVVAIDTPGKQSNTVHSCGNTRYCTIFPSPREFRNICFHRNGILGVSAIHQRDIYVGLPITVIHIPMQVSTQNSHQNSSIMSTRHRLQCTSTVFSTVERGLC